jgi:uncharacterized membrane protein YkgB
LQFAPARLSTCSTRVAAIWGTNRSYLSGGWSASAGGFPAMQGNVAFLMKDVVLFAVSFYLLKQDVERLLLSKDSAKSF